jgi:hypothetical protein
MRRALLVGIDNYPGSPLSGCVNDAGAMKDSLCCNADGSANFDCHLLTCPGQTIDRRTLKEAIDELFKHEADAALLYFSGHGTVNNLGGYLVTVDTQRYDEGVAMDDVLKLANRSKSKIGEVVIILDCCHSGALGNPPEIRNDHAVIREGVSILTASRSSQYAMEIDGKGVLTSLICDALDGGAADVCGNVTVASVYAYVDQALGAWDQRPLFKSHVSRFVSIRKCAPEIELPILRLLAKYFQNPDDEFSLDSSYEPDAEPKHEEHELIFSHLQQYRASRLLVPVAEDHMFYAATNSKSCLLTPLGRFYWKLVKENRL